MLDYNIGIPRVGSTYGNLPRNTRFGLNDVACTGTEESLYECPHTQVQAVKATVHYSFVLRDKTAGSLRLLALSAILIQRASLQNPLVLLHIVLQDLKHI